MEKPKKLEHDPGAFFKWKRKVDLSMASKVGLTSDDLEDQPYYDWFDAGLSPSQAAARAVRYSMRGE